MQTTKTQRTKTLPILLAALLLAFGLTQTAQAGSRPSIVGLWSVHYVSTTGGPEVLTFDQWHSDGLEIEAANVAPGALCQGTYKIAKDGAAHLYHVSLTFDANGAYSGYWDENLTAIVSADGRTYSGTYTRNFYDVNGNFLFQDVGTLTATRLTVQTMI